MNAQRVTDGAGSTASALFTGTVRHRRFAPVPHAFTFPLFFAYLDLADLAHPENLPGAPFLRVEKVAPLSFRRADHAGDAAIPLDTVIRDAVQNECGIRPVGPIRLLTHLRTFGHVFNPVSFYYCFDAAGTRVESVVGEVTNMPWRERHLYVGHPAADIAPGAKHRWQFRKALHVSPFMGMDQVYDWRFTDPGDAISVHMDVIEDGAVRLDATMVMRRTPLTATALAFALVRYPLMTLQVVAGIHFHAFRVWWKGNPYYDKPSPPAAVASPERST